VRVAISGAVDRKRDARRLLGPEGVRGGDAGALAGTWCFGAGWVCLGPSGRRARAGFVAGGSEAGTKSGAPAFSLESIAALAVDRSVSPPGRCAFRLSSWASLGGPRPLLLFRGGLLPGCEAVRAFAAGAVGTVATEGVWAMLGWCGREVLGSGNRGVERMVEYH
jgi:hypothetical protein